MLFIINEFRDANPAYWPFFLRRIKIDAPGQQSLGRRGRAFGFPTSRIGNLVSKTSSSGDLRSSHSKPSSRFLSSIRKPRFQLSSARGTRLSRHNC
jgi:hypothetical protein